MLDVQQKSGACARFIMESIACEGIQNQQCEYTTLLEKEENIKQKCFNNISFILSLTFFVIIYIFIIILIILSFFPNTKIYFSK